MEKGIFIKDIISGAELTALFLIASAQQQQAKNGPYWRIELRDFTGSIEAKIWFPQSQNYPELTAGSIVEIAGRAGTYRDKTELAVESMRVLSDEEKSRLNLSDFVTASSRSPADMLEELKNLCRKVFTHQPWRKFAKLLLNDESVARSLCEAPAAVSMHHAYVGGLLEHTLSVCNLCLNLAGNYPKLDNQTLLAGALCHDLGKIWELSYGLSTEYTDIGRLMGHISICAEKIEPIMQKAGLEQGLREHLKHLVLSHHGTREFGSPCLPCTKEAFILHYADNIDAKMNQISTALENIPDGDTGWSAYLKGLDRAVYRAMQTPSQQEAKAKSSSKKEKKADQSAQAMQCSLLLKE